MAEDSHHFSGASSPGHVPLYESKMVHQFDDRYGTYTDQTEAQGNQGVLPRPTDELKLDPSFTPVPRYWVKADELQRRLQTRWGSDWLLVWRKITSAVTSRTVIASIIPVSGFGDSGYVCFPYGPVGPLLVGNLNSFVVDWLARQRIGGNNLSLHVVQQLPILPPAAYCQRLPWAGDQVGDWARRYVGELVVTSSALSGFGSSLGWVGQPFRWDPGRRPRLRAELDALFLHLYGVAREDADHILESFWIVRDRDEKEFGSYRTKELILQAYDAMAVATADRPFTSQLEPPPGDPRAAHSAGPGEEMGRWAEWSEVLARPAAFEFDRSRAASRPVRPRSAAPTSHRTTAADPYSVESAQPIRRVAEGSGRPQVAAMLGTARFAHPEPASPLDSASQPTLDDLTRAATEPNSWVGENAVDPNDVQPGWQARHRSFGEGLVVWVRVQGKGVSYVIRFSGEDHEIATGYGLLELRPPNEGLA